MGLSAFGRFRVVRRLPPQVFLVRGQMKCDVSYEKKTLGIQTVHFDFDVTIIGSK
jgi:hypothetical protein